MSKKDNGCPYKATNSGSCTHKGTKANRKGLRYCGYSKPLNCDLYKEYRLNRKKFKIEASESLIDTWENEDE